MLFPDQQLLRKTMIKTLFTQGLREMMQIIMLQLSLEFIINMLSNKL